MWNLLGKRYAKQKQVRWNLSRRVSLVMELSGMTTFQDFDPKKFAATVYKDMPALTFKVNGRLHKGAVIITLNGMDYYEVYLQSGKETALINGEVRFDELGDVIDEHIERGKDWKEYSQFCRQQLSKLIETTML